jgi:quinol monooxygenase YgiN
MTEPSFRAAAILKAKAGQEQALLDFTLGAMAIIRKVDGLHKVEVSQSVSDPGQLVLYYWWETTNHSELHVRGPVYSKISPRLQALSQDHSLVVAKLVSE